MKTGIANIPLDYGTCPRWLFEKMTRLGRLLTEAIVYEFGPEEFIRRMANPYFFQSFGSLLGFDWNSSGLTTTVCGALKYALYGTEKDLGIFIAGGKGKTSRKTPQQIEDYGLRFGFEFAPKLVYASKMSAKVDSAALQDGFVLYHHSFLFTKSGNWTVVQQGMNVDIQKARRYHWHSEMISDSENHSSNESRQPARRIEKSTGQFLGSRFAPSSSSDLDNKNLSRFSFINEPHAAVCSDAKVSPLNLVAEESAKTRNCSVGLIKENFNALLKDLKKMDEKKLPSCIQRLPILDLPSDYNSPPPYLSFDYKRVEKILVGAREKDLNDFEDLLGKTNAGPATLRALALVSEIIYGARPSYRDPVRYSFAHGGKDGYPYPVDQEEYEKSIGILQRAVSKAKLGQSERLSAFKKIAN